MRKGEACHAGRSLAVLTFVVNAKAAVSHTKAGNVFFFHAGLTVAFMKVFPFRFAAKI